MACNICNGLLGHCPVCGETTKPQHSSWEEKLDSRRHQGSHVTEYQANDAPKPVKQGRYVMNTGGWKGRPNYSRMWNSRYDGPKKGSW